MSSQEICIAALVPLPYLLAGLLEPQAERHDEKTTTATLRPVITASRSSLASVSLLVASFTLLLIGALGKLRSRSIQKKGTGAGTEAGKSVHWNNQLVKDVVSRVLSVGLPFYAALGIGAERVAMIMLLVVASGALTKPRAATETQQPASWKPALRTQTWTMGFLSLAAIMDTCGLSIRGPVSGPGMGYLALALALLIFSPSFLNGARATTSTTVSRPQLRLSGSSRDTTLSLLAGGVGMTVVFLGSFTGLSLLAVNTVLIASIVGAVAAVSYTYFLPSLIQNRKKLGTLIGLAFIGLWAVVLRGTSTPLLVQLAMSGIGYLAIQKDNKVMFSHSDHHHGHSHAQKHDVEPGKISKYFIEKSEPYALLNSILREHDSRRIFYFMCLNFAFMLVQLTYGIVTGSLGLLSDSIHMFFDCLALVVGLCAAIMSKWPPSQRFPYGYGKVDTLAGFANGVFLM